MNERAKTADEVAARSHGPLERKEGSEMKRFQLVRVAFAVAAIVALAVELGAGHKFS